MTTEKRCLEEHVRVEVEGVVQRCLPEFLPLMKGNQRTRKYKSKSSLVDTKCGQVRPKGLRIKRRRGDKNEKDNSNANASKVERPDAVNTAADPKPERKITKWKEPQSEGKTTRKTRSNSVA